jgi:hypothetical protein
MAMLAVSLAFVDRRWTDSSQRVLAWGYDFHVIWIDAAGGTAKVIDLEPGKDRFSE